MKNPLWTYFGGLVSSHRIGESLAGDSGIARRAHPVQTGLSSRGTWRDLARLAGEALLAGLFASFVLALAIFIVSSQAVAAAPSADAGAGGASPDALAAAWTDAPLATGRSAATAAPRTPNRGNPHSGAVIVRTHRTDTLRPIMRGR